MTRERTVTVFCLGFVLAAIPPLLLGCEEEGDTRAQEGPHAPFALSRWWKTSNWGEFHEEWDPFQGITAGYLWKDGDGEDALVYVDVNMRQWPRFKGACTFRITGDNVDELRAKAQRPWRMGSLNVSETIVWLEGDVALVKEVGAPPLEIVEGLGARGGILYSMNCKKIMAIRDLKEDREKFHTAYESPLDDLHHDIRLARPITVKVTGFVWKHPASGTLCLDTRSDGMYSLTYRLKGDLAERLAKNVPELGDTEGLGRIPVSPCAGEAATHDSPLYAEIEGQARLKENLERFQTHQPLKKSGGYLYDLEVSKVNWALDLKEEEDKRAYADRYYGYKSRYVSYGIRFPFRARAIKSFDCFDGVEPETGDIKSLGDATLSVEKIHGDLGALENTVQKVLAIAYKTVMPKFIKEDELYLTRIYLAPHLTCPRFFGTRFIDGGLGSEVWKDWPRLKHVSSRPYWMVEIGRRKEKYRVLVDAGTSKVAYAAYYHSEKHKR
jgi:hypothetical protein